MKNHQIKNRWTGKVLFEAEAGSIKEAVEKAVSANANLAGAYLADANLTDANLTDAVLAGAVLAGAVLAGANLADANLTDANLAGADLARAYLADANLTDANLTDAYLADANLTDANLTGARNAIVNGHPVISVVGLPYPVVVVGQQVRAGCETHTADEWRNFSQDEIAEMDGKDALRFYPVLLGIIDLFCKEEVAS